MNFKMLTGKRPLGRTLITLTLLWTSGLGLAASQQVKLEPEEGQSKTATSIVKLLEARHYRDLEVDDAFSNQLLERYLDSLDPLRSNFLASDVAEFERLFGAELDDSLERGDVTPAFVIFNRYRERLQEQTHYYEEALARGLEELDFEVSESLETDRSESPWLANAEAARELWRKRFKNEVLVSKLDGSTNEEIVETLEKRYKNRQHRIEQMTSGDVFNRYMNVVSGLYDPHTTYFPPRDAENFDMMMSLSFQGIGARLTSDGELTTIMRLIPGGPAELSGKVHATDRIVSVGQGAEGEMVDVVGWRLDDVVELIRGPADTQVRLGLRSAEAQDGQRIVVLTRAEVQLEEQAADSKVLELERGERSWKVGIIDLPTFYIDFEAARAGDPEYRSSVRDVANLVVELEDAGVDGIVVDLRGNGGGSLSEVESLAGLFLGPGPVVQVRDADGKVQAGGSNEPALYSGPLVVLVDRLSASASEIFAAAVQDRGRGLVVGSRTFGKGTVQTVRPVANGQLKFTQAKFYRISGDSTQDHGVLPSVEFPSRFDPQEVGESAMLGALPWDRVPAAISKPTSWLEPILPKLRELHSERVATSPGFAYEVARNELLEELRERTSVSLQERERQAQLDRDEERLLALENSWREARGLEPFEQFDDINAEDNDDEADPLVTEAAQVLLDLVHITRVASR